MPALGLPSVTESFQRAMSSVLKPIFSTGNVVDWNGTLISMYNCELIWNIADLFPDEPQQKALIAFVGNRASSGRDEKCNDPRGLRKMAYERRERVHRTVYVGIGKKVQIRQPPYALPNLLVPADMRDVDRVWSYLAWTFRHQLASFEAVGIYQPSIPFVPAEYPLTDYWMVVGNFSCEIRYQYTVGN